MNWFGSTDLAKNYIFENVDFKCYITLFYWDKIKTHMMLYSWLPISENKLFNIKHVTSKAKHINTGDWFQPSTFVWLQITKSILPFKAQNFKPRLARNCFPFLIELCNQDAYNEYQNIDLSCMQSKWYCHYLIPFISVWYLHHQI